MNFSAWSIRNPVAPLLAFVMLLLLGWNSFNTLPITRFPNIDVPLVAVTVTQQATVPLHFLNFLRSSIDVSATATAGANIGGLEFGEFRARARREEA